MSVHQGTTFPPSPPLDTVVVRSPRTRRVLLDLPEGGPVPPPVAQLPLRGRRLHSTVNTGPERDTRTNPPRYTHPHTPTRTTHPGTHPCTTLPDYWCRARTRVHGHAVHGPNCQGNTEPRDPQGPSNRPAQLRVEKPGACKAPCSRYAGTRLLGYTVSYGSL